METVYKMKKDMKTVGYRLKEIRLIYGLTQSQLAERIKVNQITIARMESGNGSSAVLIGFLFYYAQFINIDIIFDDKMWNLVEQDKELLLKKVHLSSIVNEKYRVMKDNMIKELKKQRNQLDKTLQGLETYIESGLDSAISYTEED